MEINKILSADFLDILFEGRNKEYGAYELRKNYDRRLRNALLITAGVALLIFLIVLVSETVGAADKNKVKISDVHLLILKRKSSRKLSRLRHLLPSRSRQKLRSLSLLLQKL